MLARLVRRNLARRGFVEAACGSECLHGLNDEAAQACWGLVNVADDGFPPVNDGHEILDRDTYPVAGLT